jgi:hypothetical protein
VDPGPEREEQLVSISTDGKVKAWTVAKGLEHHTLITLKRVPHRRVASAGSSRGSDGGSAAAAAAAAAGAAVPAGSGAKAAATVAALRGDGSGSRGAVISRNTGGMSFDFSSLDKRMFLAGEGLWGYVIVMAATECFLRRGLGVLARFKPCAGHKWHYHAVPIAPGTASTCFT